VQVVVDPPVPDAVREALAVVLRERGVVGSGPESYDDAWRRAGLYEGVDRDGDDSSYALSPRSTRGATRA
jgi:hypothetical protein